jgi:hypothetical protein
MKHTLLSLFVALLISGGSIVSVAAQMKDKVKVEVETAGLHPGMEPGMYICASNHLHIKGTVENLSERTLGRIKVGGKAFGADGKLIGTAVGSTKQASLAPGQKAEINVEFLTVTGPLIEKVKKHELTVTDAPEI